MHSSSEDLPLTPGRSYWVVSIVIREFNAPVQGLWRILSSARTSLSCTMPFVQVVAIEAVMSVIGIFDASTCNLNNITMDHLKDVLCVCW